MSNNQGITTNAQATDDQDTEGHRCLARGDAPGPQDKFLARGDAPEGEDDVEGHRCLARGDAPEGIRM